MSNIHDVEIEVERDVPCRTWTFQTKDGSPIAYTRQVHMSDSVEEKQTASLSNLTIPDRTLRWLYPWLKEMLEK